MFLIQCANVEGHIWPLHSKSEKQFLYSSKKRVTILRIISDGYTLFLLTIFDCGIYVAFLCLLSRELCHIKVMIPALLSKQLLVVSALHYLTMIHNDNLVCILNSG